MLQTLVCLASLFVAAYVNFCNWGLDFYFKTNSQYVNFLSMLIAKMLLFLALTKIFARKRFYHLQHTTINIDRQLSCTTITWF